MTSPTERPPITYVKTEFREGNLIARLSESQTAIPHFGVELGKLRPDLSLSRYIPFDQLDTAIALLTRVRDEQGPAIREKIAAAEAEQATRRAEREQQRRRSPNNNAEYGGGRKRSTKPGAFKARPEPDFRKADQRSARAREENRWQGGDPQ